MASVSTTSHGQGPSGGVPARLRLRHPKPGSAGGDARAAFAAALDSGGAEAFADMAMASSLFAAYCSQGPSAQRFIRSCLMTHRARGIAHTAREVLARRRRVYELEPQLKALRVPTRLIVGDGDAPCLKVHEFMARTIPGARSLVLRGTGHLSNLESPAAFNAAVSRFLAKTV